MCTFFAYCRRVPFQHHKNLTNGDTSRFGNRYMVYIMLSPQIKNPYKCKLSCTSGKVFRAVLAVPLFLAIYFFYQSSLNKDSYTYLDLGIKPDTSTILSKDFGFHLSIHPKSREERFVSFDDRVSEIVLF